MNKDNNNLKNNLKGLTILKNLKASRMNKFGGGDTMSQKSGGSGSRRSGGSGSRYQNSQGNQVIDDFSEMSSSNFSMGHSNKLN